MDNITIKFSSCHRGYWLLEIVNAIDRVDNYLSDDSIQRVTIDISENVTAENLEPFHIVLLACFIEYLQKKNCSKVTLLSDLTIEDLIMNDLKFDKYFNEGSVHEDARNNKVHLWKVVDNQAYMYSISVMEYFDKNYFQDYDMTGLKNSLDEIYANIADHSKSDGIAFSYIAYNQQKKKIFVAACDYGLGIARTLKQTNSQYKSDSEALRDSINIGVTAKTTPRNKGFGLDNVVSNLTEDDMFRIVSNKSLLTCFGGKKNIKIYDIDFEFKGTLIYFEICTNSFLPKDIENEAIIM
jgi:hypothetical protein